MYAIRQEDTGPIHQNLIREYFVYRWGRSVWGVFPRPGCTCRADAPCLIIALDLPGFILRRYFIPLRLLNGKLPVFIPYAIGVQEISFQLFRLFRFLFLCIAPTWNNLHPAYRNISANTPVLIPGHNPTFLQVIFRQFLNSAYRSFLGRLTVAMRASLFCS